MAAIDPQQQREFAIQVTAKIRAAGHVAYWAGGCVRDQLLGRRPKDYDVATSARPAQIREIFGARRTLELGAAFCVITVLGPKQAGQIEVATFREDAAYSDGRRPDAVSFSTPAEDAKRRDFTINGLFYDPAADEVIDFVGGQEDLARGIIRAIGDAQQRFAEDKLRLLRAVRFAATYDFEIEPATRAAIARMASEITVVSAERIAAEMRLMLTHAQRAKALRLLAELGLLAAVLPEVTARIPAFTPPDMPELAVLEEPSFALGLAAALYRFMDPASAEAICLRWRLSNQETGRIAWLVANSAALQGASTRPWPEVQRLLVSPGIHDLLELHAAIVQVHRLPKADLEFCRAMLARPAAELNPQPLISGDDLIQHGIPAGKHFQPLLAQVRDAQLDGLIATKQQAIGLADQLWKGSQ